MRIVKRKTKTVIMVERCPLDDPKLPKDVDTVNCTFCSFNKGTTNKEEILCGNVQRWEE